MLIKTEFDPSEILHTLYLTENSETKIFLGVLEVKSRNLARDRILAAYSSGSSLS